MNSTAKGDRFEDEVYSLLRQIVDDERFFIKAEHCRVERKPVYYSRDREANIVFDLSVEAWLPGAERASLVIPIECKDYGHSVPVDDVEEFSDKCRQVHAHKGILISRSHFQKAGQAISRSRGIGLIRIFGRGDYKWILERSTCANLVWIKADERELLENLLYCQNATPQIDLVGDTRAGATLSLWEFLHDLTETTSSSENPVIPKP